ncbi:carboxymuconolactone decarboxylase family protein [Dermatobacter hominis]|uniref:carboxymuconolactone decarboxylase family protein n=1 Tax=Dermatobacter hominis TaxID=2884263 RepID=UPI001D0F935C|nr:carboxymuconolactone decarboxylase family protein [Dermatobacter hominis]UDY35104.1 carboxymuconolactone decarboxylase family protein [Dermatobacter hominis]
MSARIPQPAVAVPAAMAALQSLGAAIGELGVPPTTVTLVNVRASQINGCAVCLEGAIREAAAVGETSDRLMLVSAWRETPSFSAAERAALALTEAVTRTADSEDPVPDDVWDEAAAHYDEQQLTGLVLQIANINVWNRLNVATRQQAGVHTW